MSALGETATDVILRDGSTLRLRAPLADDEQAMLEFFAGLSERSRYLRFHGFPALTPKLVAPFLDPDWDERGALLGCLEGRIVALANFVRLRDRRSAEVAFTVADDFQGRGVGTRLLERLAETAADAGIQQFVAEVMSENRSMLVVFRDAGFELIRELEGGSVEVRFPIAPTEGYRDRVAERDHVAVRRIAPPVLRAGVRRGHRRVVTPRLDRRGALPQHPHGRLHRRCVSRQPRRRSRRRACAGIRASPRSPSTSTSRSSACRASTCSLRPRRMRSRPE